MTSSSCKTSALSFTLYNTVTMTIATSAVFGKDYSTTPITYYVSTSDTALAGTVYNLKL